VNWGTGSQTVVNELIVNVLYISGRPEKCFFCSIIYSKQKETNDARDAPVFLERYFC
jgi:hypothetical protein